MSCERYWREGIVLVERGLDDPHRDGCDDCVRAHASRQELIDALPLIGADYLGDPEWQAKVWQRIDGRIDGRAHAPWRWRWQLGGALTAACVIALWIGLGRDVRPRFEVLEGSVAMRSRGPHVDDRLQNAHVDDRLRITVGETSNVWIYRADRLVLSCRARKTSAGCTPDAHGMVVDLLLSAPGTYRAFVFDAPGALTPRGGLDEDLAALESANVSYKEHRVSVY